MPVVKDKDMTPQNGQVDEVKLVYKEKPVVNIDGITARDMLETSNNARFEMYARGVVESLPEHWRAGDPGKASTYPELKVRELAQINNAFRDAMFAAKPSYIDGFALDVWDVTVKEMDNLAGQRVMELVARYATKVPAAWGDLHDVETYLNLPHPVWLKVQDIVTEALQDLAKN